MQDLEFDALVDQLFNDIEDAIDNLDRDLDVDASGSILNIEFPKGSTVVISRQVANHEVWVAAKSGGYHLGHMDGQWRCSATAEDLSGLLSRVLSEQLGELVTI